MRSLLVSAALVSLWALFAPAARADVIAAEELFRQGKAEMAKGNHARACPMFAESYRQDAAMGTLLNLALCHEAIGKIATAWGEWRAVEQQARAAVPPREDRMKLAREHAEALEPRLSRIRIDVPSAEARVEGLVVTVDGEPKGEPLWGGVPVDPGTHVIAATAPGKKKVTLSVKVDDEGVLVPVAIPQLEDEPEPVAAAARGGDVQSIDLERVEALAANRARRTAGFVVGGLGIATLAVGAVFGVAAIVNDGAAQDACPAPCIAGSGAAAEADRNTDRALVFANIANVTIPLGLVGTAIGTYLVLTSGPSTKVSIAPAVSKQASGLSVSARW
jgi:hypothetical protein